jgi:hypothetical protein
MTPQTALVDLLMRIDAQGGNAVLVNGQALAQWPPEAIAAMKLQKLLIKARPAISADCHGCERACVMPVHTVARPGGVAGSFVVCDKRSDTSRVIIPPERLLQWRCDVDAICGFVAASLGLRSSDQHSADAAVRAIGMARGDKRSQMLALRLQGGLALVAGSQAILLVDLVDFLDGSFVVDAVMVRQMVDTAPPADARHTPSTAKREARKVDTQAMYASWQKAYRALRKKSPGKSEVWYSQQIAKADKVHVRDASTVKKHMKS